MRRSVAAAALAVVAAAGLLVNPFPGMDGLGTLGRAEAAVPVPVAPATPFPGIDGVDLAGLGYRGVDLDAVTVAMLDGPLPELPTERASDLRSRIVVGTAHLEGLRRAEYLLYEAARAMDPKVNWSRRAQLEAWEAQERAESRLTRAKAAADQQAADRSGHSVLDLGVAVSAAALRAVEDATVGTRVESATLAGRLDDQLARRSRLRAGLDLTSRAAGRMQRHIRYLEAELHRARAGMLPAGRWLAETWRGRSDIPLARVRGFRVHAAIAGSLADLLAAAEADGIVLRGKGYRSIERQIELRTENCGPTAHDIHEKPSGACSPPTARPGRSLHESGLAVDFRHGREGITSRSSPAFQWLAANAASYGFFNLPSEPWHWSASGY